MAILDKGTRTKDKPTEQDLLNLSFDGEIQVIAHEIVGSPQAIGAGTRDMYGVKVFPTGGLAVVNPDGSDIFGSGGTFNSAPTFKDDPTNGTETPKFGKTNPTSHKQEVEVDAVVSNIAQETGGNLDDIDAKLDQFTFTGGRLEVDAVIDASEITIGAVNILDSTDTEINPAKEDGNLAEIASDTDKLDVALSTRLKPADTLAKVSTVDTITNPVNTLEGTGLVPKIYDSLTYTNTSATVDTYKYYQGGIAGTLIATLTITWTDSTKKILTSVVRT